MARQIEEEFVLDCTRFYFRVRALDRALQAEKLITEETCAELKTELEGLSKTLPAVIRGTKKREQ